MNKLRLPALGGSLMAIVILVGFLFVMPDGYTCNVSAQETTCDDIVATNNALYLENRDLRATLEAQNQSISPLNACFLCIEGVNLSLTAMSSTSEPIISATPVNSVGAFTDDFTNDSGRFDLADMGQIIDGELMITTSTEQSYVLVPHEVNSPLQIIVQARFPVEALADNQTAINILYGDIDNENYVYIRIKSDFIDVSQVQGNEEQFLQSLSLPDMELDWTQYQNITINFQDNLGLYINNQFLGLSNYSYTGNQIALGLQYFGVSGSSSVYFDNLQIVPLEP